jgi:hypothetical protein
VSTVNGHLSFHHTQGINAQNGWRIARALTWFTILVLASAASLLPGGAEPDRGDGGDDELGFQPLFSDRALKLWQQCGPGRFMVEKGVATGEGGMGLWWFSGQQFTNFVLRGEFVQEQPIADSGIFVRFRDPKNDPWNAVHQGHEMEIGDPEPKDPTWRTGSIYPFAASSKANTQPPGHWNRYELTCRDQQYLVRINGELVLNWTDPSQRTRSGYIGLQNYNDGKTVRHRHMRIKELP